MTTTFFRLLHTDDKAAALAEAVATLRGSGSNSDVYIVNPQGFRQIPGSPFAYWISERVRAIFPALPSFEGGSRNVRQGLATADDFRFVRGWWEIQSAAIGRSMEDTLRDSRWITFAKGGKVSPYYSDLYLVVDWQDAGRRIKSNLNSKGKVRSNVWMLWDTERFHFFRPGLTWPLRASRFAPTPLPAGSIFSVRGYAILAPISDLPVLLALGSTSAFDALFKLALGRFHFPEFIVGTLQRMPYPMIPADAHNTLERFALTAIEMRRSLDTSDETSRIFTVPAAAQAQRAGLVESIATWAECVKETDQVLTQSQAIIDDLSFRLYGISDEDRGAIEAFFGSDVANEDDPEGDEDEETEAAAAVDAAGLVDALISWSVGCAFGRWDVRLALDPSLAPALQGPFEPLPVCSPGMLVGPDGLPARQGGIASEAWLRARPDAITLPEAGAVERPTIADDAYPLRVDWDGIMVDDEGHPDDILGRVRGVLRLLWGEHADEIEREACEILGVGELRDYLRHPRRFWDAHVRRYSKSRRKAPIYWLLQSSRRSYGLWLNYHRMDADILYKALRRYVDPKLTLEGNRLEDLRARLPEAVAAGGRVRREAERAVERQQALIAEIEEFRRTLEAVALQNLTVDHDDGVLLSIAPLHALVPWGPAKQAWDELVAGKYEWSTMGQRMRERGLVGGRRR